MSVIAGAVMVFLSGWLGLALLIGGALIDRRAHLCGACMNAVGKESRLCPVCGVSLTGKKSTGPVKVRRPGGG